MWLVDGAKLRPFYAREDPPSTSYSSFDDNYFDPFSILVSLPFIKPLFTSVQSVSFVYLVYVSFCCLISLSIDRSTFPLRVVVLTIPMYSTAVLTTPPWLATAVSTDFSEVFHFILHTGV
jgi:hypothetical protein